MRQRRQNRATLGRIQSAANFRSGCRFRYAGRHPRSSVRLCTAAIRNGIAASCATTEKMISPVRERSYNTPSTALPANHARP